MFLQFILKPLKADPGVLSVLHCEKVAFRKCCFLDLVLWFGFWLLESKN
jgi:hypothetical protein